MQSILPIVGLTLALSSWGSSAQTPAAPAPDAVTLTYADALQRARQYSQQVYSARIAEALAHEDTVQAKAALLPTAEGISGYIYTQPNGTPSGVYVPNDGPHIYTEQLNIHSDLYSPAKRAELRRTAAAEAVAKARKDLAERGLIATVTGNFYAMAVAQRKVANAEASLKEARDFENLSRKQEQGGEAAKVDVVKAQLQVRQRERDLDDARATLDKARFTFAVILFPTYNQSFSLADDLERSSKLPAFPEVQSMAGKSSPDMRAAQATVQQQTSAISEARAGYLPTLSFDYYFGLQANQLALHDPQGYNNLGSSVVAQLTVPLWNWGTNRSKVKQAELQLQQAKSDLSLTQRTLLANLDGYYLEARVSAAQIESLRESMTLSIENLRLTRLRYTAGESSAQEVVDAQTTLVEARNAFDDGLVRYRLALANLQTLTGAF